MAATTSPPTAKVEALPLSVDSQWIWTYNGQDWPVVLCGDELAPSQFVAGRNHDEEVAAILLGRRKYIWVLQSGLREYDPHKDYDAATSKYERIDDSDVAKLSKQRGLAFAQDVKEFQTAAYWKNLIEQQREARILAREISVSSDGRKRRKRTESDSPMDQGQLLTPRSTPRKKTKTTTNAEHTATDKSRSAQEPQNSCVPRQLRRQNQHLVMQDPPLDGICTVFVGSAKTPFRLSSEATRASMAMRDRMTYNVKFRSHIDMSDIEELTDEHFDAVVEYLQHDDFTPAIITNTIPPHLEGVEDLGQKHEAAVKCAEVFQSASHLQLGGLQMLCLDKLKSLYPLETVTILFVSSTCMKATPWECEAEIEYHEWIVAHFAEYYGILKREWPDQLAQVFERSQALAKEVKEKLAADPEMGRFM
ncbi:hypothetical protein LTR86_002485 [Recurvomyces mirabilis]|nr:hypothetical protein LTR86_002485 [Recurvomyces mirabilis]